MARRSSFEGDTPAGRLVFMSGWSVAWVACSREEPLRAVRADPSVAESAWATPVPNPPRTPPADAGSPDTSAKAPARPPPYIVDDAGIVRWPRGSRCGGGFAIEADQWCQEGLVCVASGGIDDPGTCLPPTGIPCAKDGARCGDAGRCGFVGIRGKSWLECR
jgi:hypothetical protein